MSKNLVVIHQYVLEKKYSPELHYVLTHSEIEAEENPKTYRAKKHFADYTTTARKESLRSVRKATFKKIYLSLEEDLEEAVSALEFNEAEELMSNIKSMEKKLEEYKKTLYLVNKKEYEIVESRR